MLIFLRLLYCRLTNRDLVSNGLSLNGTSLSVIKHSRRESNVRCIITVENWSMYTLLDVETNNECGKLHKDLRPRNVFPGYREVLVAHQVSFMDNSVCRQSKHGPFFPD